MPVNNAISVTRNGAYGGPNNNNKYKPFSAITVVNAPANIADYSYLVDDRMAGLALTGVFPANLNLAMPSWAFAARNEIGKSPPLVVVSSNRSRYILAGVTSANNQLRALALPGAAAPASFRNVNDLRALPNPAAPSPPIYCPTRQDPAFPRSVYVVVQYSEYADYLASLAPTGINVVGWAFSNPAAALGVPPSFLSGFGASRYAALEFCKQLRTAATAANSGVAPWNAAWLFDDNVVAIQGLQSLNAVEAALGVNVCAGFKGQSVPMNFGEINNWANTIVPVNQRGGLNLPALPISTADLVQQAACWNIDQLQQQNLNFSPIFVDSKEDVSLTDYFNTSPIAYQWYNRRIMKEIVTLQDNAAGGPGLPALNGAIRVQSARDYWATTFANREQNTPLQPPGPGVVQTALRPFIDNVVVPNAPAMAAVAGNVPTRRHAACQAIESVVSRAIRGGFPPPGQSYVNVNSLAATFSPPAAPPLGVTRRDIT